MTRWRTRYAAIAAAVAIFPCAIACTNVSSADPAIAQRTDLNVAVVPAVDSVGFFIALGVTRVVAAVMALDSYPFGPVDEVRIQTVADIMHEFLGDPRFSVAGMIGNPG